MLFSWIKRMLAKVAALAAEPEPTLPEVLAQVRAASPRQVVRVPESLANHPQVLKALADKASPVPSSKPAPKAKAKPWRSPKNTKSRRTTARSTSKPAA